MITWPVLISLVKHFDKDMDGPILLFKSFEGLPKIQA